jgi:hypothetical protein
MNNDWLMREMQPRQGGALRQWGRVSIPSAGAQCGKRREEYRSVADAQIVVRKVRCCVAEWQQWPTLGSASGEI